MKPKQKLPPGSDGGLLRIILPVNDGRLIAINAENGKLCETLSPIEACSICASNMPDAPNRVCKEPTSPPIITDKTIVMAGSVIDNFLNLRNVWRDPWF